MESMRVVNCHYTKNWNGRSKVSIKSGDWLEMCDDELIFAFFFFCFASTLMIIIWIRKKKTHAMMIFFSCFSICSSRCQQSFCFFSKLPDRIHLSRSWFFFLFVDVIVYFSPLMFLFTHSIAYYVRKKDSIVVSFFSKTENRCSTRKKKIEEN